MASATRRDAARGEQTESGNNAHLLQAPILKKERKYNGKNILMYGGNRKKKKIREEKAFILLYL